MTNIQEFDANAVDVETPDRTIRLAIWRFPRDGRFSQLWNITTGARAALSVMLKRIHSIKDDRRLSEDAQKEDAKEAALDSLRDIGQRQRALNEGLTKAQSELLQLAAIPGYAGQAAAAEAVIDCEIARHFRSLAGEERSAYLKKMFSGEYEREIDAFLRLPHSLTGLQEEARRAVSNSALQRRSPGAVAEFEQYFEAAETTQWILRKVVENILSSSMVTPQEQMQALGRDAWEPFVKVGSPEVNAALASRYVA